MKSLSEIETVSKRASRAAGYSWGICEEVGKNIRLLEMFGLPGIKNLNDYFDKKKKQIIAHVVANAMNPQTGGPHPPQRIENAIDEARFSIDPMEAIERQVEKLIKSIKPLIPISFEKIRVAVKIQAIHVGKCYGQISSLATIQSEEYQKDGSWIGMLEMSAASFVKLEDALGSLTKGTAETKML